jgi:hypothetical protein
MGRLEEKQRQYDEIMKSRRGPPPSGLTGTVDPFSGSVDRLMDEVDILERLAKSWKLSFTPCTLGAGTLTGGLYLAYDQAGTIKALVHPERFHTTIAEQTLNFWSFQVDNGLETAKKNGIPFVIIIELQDGLYALNFNDAKEFPVRRRAVGQRIAKRREFEDVVSAVDYIDTTHFKSLRRKAE